MVSFDIGNTLIWSPQSGFCKLFSDSIGVPFSDIKSLFFKHFLTKNQTIEDAVNSILLDIDVENSGFSVENYRKPVNYAFYDSLPTLKGLHNLGYKSIIGISNCTPWEKSDLSRFGFEKYILKVNYSFSIGYAKPSPMIFEYVQKRYNVSPESILHIGDSWGADIEGAVSCGWKVIFLNRKSKYDINLKTSGVLEVNSLLNILKIINYL